MNDAYISALAALAGSGIGALASVGTTWLTHRYQDRSQRLAQNSARLEQVFGDASQCLLMADCVAKVGGMRPVRNNRIQEGRRLNQSCAAR